MTIQVYDRITRTFIDVTPTLQPEYDSILNEWRDSGGRPTDLPRFLESFCDVATGRIDPTVTATDAQWAGHYLRYLDRQERQCPPCS